MSWYYFGRQKAPLSSFPLIRCLWLTDEVKTLSVIETRGSFRVGKGTRQRWGSKEKGTAAGGEWRRDVHAPYREWVLSLKCLRGLALGVLSKHGGQMRMSQRRGKLKPMCTEFVEHAFVQTAHLKPLLQRFAAPSAWNISDHCGNPGWFIAVPTLGKEVWVDLVFCADRCPISL